MTGPPALGRARRRARLSPRELEILGLLSEGFQAKAIASRLGLHETTVRNHIQAVLRKLSCHSQLEAVALARRVGILAGSQDGGRPAAAPDARRADRESGYRLLAEILAACLSGSEEDLPLDPEQAGRAWGRELLGRAPGSPALPADEAVDELLALLSDLDFEARLAGPPGRPSLFLRGCPFADVARSYRDVVCSVHLGLIRGALDELGESVEAVRVEPFVEPDLCAVHLLVRAKP